jgi:hypothetical protein
MLKLVSLTVVVALVATFAVVLGADGNKVPNKKAGSKLTGVVTVDGQPVTGRLFFHVTEDQFFGGRIDEDGRFVINKPPRGTFRVTIEGNRVPERFTSLDSELNGRIESGENVLDFELATRD